MAPRRIAAGNWKMNGGRAALDEISALAAIAAGARCGVIICPPAPLIAEAVARAGRIIIGGQDCHSETAGAHTGDVSAHLLAELGAGAVIVGHSERRADHGERDRDVAAKAAAAHDAGLTAIICIGETEAERDSGQTLQVIESQLIRSLPAMARAADTIIAYEPVWAIGTGRTPSEGQIAEVHARIRATLIDQMSDGADVTLLYGGSVKAANAAAIFAVENVDGALVGGASLTAADFGPIITALSEAAGPA